MIRSVRGHSTLPALRLSIGSDYDSYFAGTVRNVVVLHGRPGREGVERDATHRAAGRREDRSGHVVIALGETTRTGWIMFFYVLFISFTKRKLDAEKGRSSTNGLVALVA